MVKSESQQRTSGENIFTGVADSDLVQSLQAFEPFLNQHVWPQKTADVSAGLRGMKESFGMPSGNSLREFMTGLRETGLLFSSEIHGRLYLEREDIQLVKALHDTALRTPEFAAGVTADTRRAISALGTRTVQRLGESPLAERLRININNPGPDYDAARSTDYKRVRLSWGKSAYWRDQQRHIEVLDAGRLLSQDGNSTVDVTVYDHAVAPSDVFDESPKDTPLAGESIGGAVSADSSMWDRLLQGLDALQDPEKKNVSQVEEDLAAAPRDDIDAEVAVHKAKKSRSARHPDWVTATTNDADTTERLNDADSPEDDVRSSRQAVLRERLIKRNKASGEATIVWKEPLVYPELTADEQERISLIEQERREQKSGIPILPEDLADKLYGWERHDIDSAIKALVLTRQKGMSPLPPPNMHEFTQQAVRFLAWRDAGKPAEKFEFYPKKPKPWDIHKALVSVAYQMIEQELADAHGNGPSLNTMMRQATAVVIEENVV